MTCARKILGFGLFSAYKKTKPLYMAVIENYYAIYSGL